MAWYATGTATFTNSSTNVTGVGTSWIANAAVGDALHAPDGVAYEITGVVSDTSLTIDPAYQATTAAAASYKIQPTRGVTLSLRDQVAQLIADYQDVADNAGTGKFAAGTTSAPSLRGIADQDTGVNLPGGNLLEFILGGVKAGWIDGATMNLLGAMVQSNATDATAGKLLPVGAFGLGAGAGPLLVNVDDLASSGFYYGFGGAHAAATPGTNPFPVGSGEFGLISQTSLRGTAGQYLFQIAIEHGSGRAVIRARASAGWSAWREIFHQNTVLGTVSQASGVPTGALIESGSNTNGEYVRLADGTQICTHILAANASAAAVWTFPAVFSTTAGLTPGGIGWSTAPRFCTASGLTTTTMSFSVYDIAGTRTVQPGRLTAIGRWF